MHVYAYYGRGNTIHSPCQIKGFHNSCDENPIMLEANSHHFLDGYATPLECRSGLLYMSILRKPTDQDLDQYPHVLLTSPHKWDTAVLDYVHHNACGYPSWAPDPSVRDQHDPRIYECGNI